MNQLRISTYKKKQVEKDFSWGKKMIGFIYMLRSPINEGISYIGSMTTSLGQRLAERRRYYYRRTKSKPEWESFFSNKDVRIIPVFVKEVKCHKELGVYERVVMKVYNPHLTSLALTERTRKSWSKKGESGKDTRVCTTLVKILHWLLVEIFVRRLSTWAPITVWTTELVRTTQLVRTYSEIQRSHHNFNFKMAHELQQMLIHGAFLFEVLCRFRFVSDAFRILKIRVSEFIVLLCTMYTAFNHIEAVRILVPELIVAFENEIEKVYNNCIEQRQNDNGELLFQERQ